jgi:hypothetical protein
MAAMSADVTFHFPPELFNLLVDTIPLISRSKKDVLTFFRGAGVPDNLTSDIAERLRTAREEVNKYDITRLVLERLNARGEPALRERREVLRRVVEFSNFDSCWPTDQLKAKGLVASIREVVNQKDAFTRINQAREDERQARLSELDKVNRERRARSEAIDAAKREFYSLFAEGLAPAARGKTLEIALNNLFKAYGILAREAFHVVGIAGEGIVEQIDGVIEIKGALYFVEMKWYRNPVGVPEISEHLVRLMGRAEARGIFISASDYTAPAVSVCRDFLQQKLMSLVTLREIVHMLEKQGDLEDFLAKKIQAAQMHKDPFYKPI